MVFITAEIGINHNGDISIAKKLIEIAKNAGCDAVKFQKRDVEKVYSKEILNQPRESPWGTTQRDQKLGLELSLTEYSTIDKYCKKKRIPWFVSCWDVGSQIQMRKFKSKYNKVASAMLVHNKLLKTIAEEKKYTFISTGMSTLKDIEKAVKIFRKFKCKVGYSGHETGSYLICVAATLFGATSIERHITLDRTMYGSDQAASLEPGGLFRLVRDLKELEKIIGDGKKRIWDSELPAKEKLRQILT